MRKLLGIRAVAITALVSSAVLLPALSANAATDPPTSHVYANCTAVHKYYSGGIAKAGVKYNVIHHANGTTSKEKLKGHVLHSTTAYDKNKKLDRDKDGVACEKS